MLKSLNTYHKPACGSGYKQYSREKDCQFITNKPCESCMFNLKKRKEK